MGREIQLGIAERIADQVEAGRRPPHTVLVGLRGVGKTVLVREVVRRLRGRGWLCGYYEIRRDVEVGRAIGTIVLEGSQLLSTGTRFIRRLRKLSASIGSATLTGSSAGTLSLSFRTDTERTTDPYLETLSLFRALAAGARDEGVGVALCVDEIQDFRRADATVMLQALEADQDEDSRVLLFAAGLPHTSAVLAKARTYAERFRYEPIDDLSPAEARRAVAEPADSLGVRWDSDALDRVVALSQGYPYFLQLYASEAWAMADGPASVTPADLAEAEPRVGRLLDAGLYSARYRRVSAGEQTYLAAVAALMGPDGRVRSGDVVRELGKTHPEASPVRDRLIRKGVIHAPEDGVLAFSVPGFADYVRRQA